MNKPFVRGNAKHNFPISPARHSLISVNYVAGISEGTHGK